MTPLADGPAAAPQTENQRLGRDAIVIAAIEVMSDRSYDGTSMRDIAAQLRTSSSNLYSHFHSKQHILFQFMQDLYAQQFRALATALALADDEPVSRFTAIVDAQVRYQLGSRIAHLASIVGHAEIDRLEVDNREVVIGLRERRDALFIGVITEGLKSAVFKTSSAERAARAAIILLSSIPESYMPGEVSADEVAARHVALLLALVGYGAPEAANATVRDPGRRLNDGRA